MSQSTIYDQAAKAVVKMLETAGTDWCQPWQVNGSRNVVTDKQYRGINTLILASTHYPSGTWGTLRRKAKRLQPFLDRFLPPTNSLLKCRQHKKSLLS